MLRPIVWSVTRAHCISDCTVNHSVTHVQCALSMLDHVRFDVGDLDEDGRTQLAVNV